MTTPGSNSTTSKPSSLLKKASPAFQVVQWLPTDIAKKWEVIREALVKSLPEEEFSEDLAAKIQARLLLGSMEAWIGCDEKGLPAVLGLIEAVVEPGTLRKNVLLYTLFGFGGSLRAFRNWKSTMFERWTKQGFVGVIAYSNKKEVVDLSKRFGADTSFVQIEWKLKEKQ